MIPPVHKIAVCIGHSRSIGKRQEGGAAGWDGHTNELEYNTILAQLIRRDLKTFNIDSMVFGRYEGVGYAAAMDWLAHEIDKFGCTDCMELHFNSAGPLAQGEEVLYLEGSVRGKLFAGNVESQLSSALSNQSRGAKALSRNDRGALFCLKTRGPAIITEPFFGSSKVDWEKVASRPNDISMAIAKGTYNYIKALVASH